MRYLGIDIGDKRTGLALAESDLRMAVPVDVIQVPIHNDAGRQLLEALVKAVTVHLGDRRQSGELVVGYPLNMDGTEGRRAVDTRAFAELLAQRTGRALHLQDERLTTAAADWSLARSGMTHKQKKERRDAIAAAALLQEFMNRHLGPRSDSGAPSDP